MADLSTVDRLTQADLDALKLPTWIDRNVDVKKREVDKVGEPGKEEVFYLDVETPKHLLRANVRHFHPGERTPHPVKLETGETIEFDRTSFVVKDSGSFAVRKVANRKTGEVRTVILGTAVIEIDRKLTEAHNPRYWQNA